MDERQRRVASLPAAPTEDRRVRAVCLGLALVTLLLYARSSTHGFILLDDGMYVTENKTVQAGWTWAGLAMAFGSWSEASNWHPLTWISHMTDCQWFGLNPGAHHVVSVLFHAANSVLLFLVVRRMTRRLWPSAFVAAVFAWHPLHVESVAWVAERKDVLSTFFALWSLWFYAGYAQESDRHAGNPPPSRRPWNRTYTLALAFFALSLLSKPMLVTLPFVFLLLDFWPFRRLEAPGVPAPGSADTLPRRAARLALEKWPFFLLSAAVSVITFLAQREQAVVPLSQFPFESRLANSVFACARYVAYAFWPEPLAVPYPLPPHRPWGAVAMAAAVVAGISAAAWLARRRAPALLTGWCWFLGMLVPVIGLVQVGSQAMADRYTYLPLAGLTLALAFPAADWVRSRGIAPVYAACVSGIVLAGLAGLTWRQLGFWRDTETLFRHSAAVTENNSIAHLLLFETLEMQGRREESLKEARAAMEAADSDRVQDLLNVAWIRNLLAGEFERSGDPAEAKRQYKLGIKATPEGAEIRNNYGTFLERQGRLEEALAEFQTVVRLKPSDLAGYQNLAGVLVRLGRVPEAMQAYDEAARLHPGDSEPHYLKGKAWLRLGRPADAAAQFREAVSLNPADYQSMTYLARMLASAEDASMRNGAEALVLAQKANELSGNQQPLVLDALAMALAESGRFTEAAAAQQRAVDIAGAAGAGALESQMRGRLAIYRQSQPYREAFTNAAAAHAP
ncbi:MAG: tetratricopeptide repeat protein [Verrucomicrobiota bacterium]